MTTDSEDDMPELPDREIWEAPRRLSLEEARAQIGGPREPHPRSRWDAGEEDDQ
ncbi:MAG: hypothetical protein ACT6RD_05040 [Brevundimonas sp.]|uniref:hypothetical protein n=1 Tax=Brevundimonas sp. TaxID=1871086 RepID=UPI004034F4FD